MNRGVKRILHLSRISRKNDLSLIGGYFIHHKSMFCQPTGDPGQVLAACPKAGSILGRGKPLMVERRPRIVLRFHQYIQGCLLCRRRF